jgi:hypothetical protein
MIWRQLYDRVMILAGLFRSTISRENKTHLHRVDSPAPIVPLVRQRSLDRQELIHTADLARVDSAPTECSHVASRRPPRVRESCGEYSLNDVVADRAGEAGPHRGVVGDVHGIEECDFTNRNAVCQFKASQTENFELASRASEKGGGHLGCGPRCAAAHRQRTDPPLQFGHFDNCSTAGFTRD